MQSQRFTAVVAAAGPVKLLVPIPFDPNQVWAAKQRHHVAGTVNGMRVRAVLERQRAGGPLGLHRLKQRGQPRVFEGSLGLHGGDEVPWNKRW